MYVLILHEYDKGTRVVPVFYLNFNVNRIYGYIKINVKTGLAPVDEAAKSLHTVPPHCKN